MPQCTGTRFRVVCGEEEVKGCQLRCIFATLLALLLRHFHTVAQTVFIFSLLTGRAWIFSTTSCTQDEFLEQSSIVERQP